MRITKLWVAGLILLMASPAWAVPNNTLSITPAAASNTTITAADENARNSAISSAYNAHSHTDISDMSGVNTFRIGDGNTGTKTFSVNDSQSGDPALRYATATGYWTISSDGSTFDAIGLSSGNVIQGENNFRVGDGTSTGNKTITANEDSVDGVIRWLTASDRWEIANDATNFSAIQTVSGNTIVAGINEIQLGDGTTTAPKIIYANTTSALQDPAIRYQPDNSRWELANNSNDFGAILFGGNPMSTQGDIEYHNGTSRQRLAAGTSGQFLKTQGAGSNPVWAATKTTVGATGSIVNGATAYYMASLNDSTEDNVSIVVPFACTAKNLSLRINNTTSATVVVTVYQNGSPTSIVATATSTDTGTFQDTTHSVSLSAGDRISFLVVNNRAATFNGRITLELNPL